jgi:GST-like protein
MIDLLTWKTPNGWKISIMLEETGLEYTLKPVDIGTGAQHRPEFLDISPNGKIPAIVDYDAAGGPLKLFESAAILTYLADKSGQFLAPTGAARYQALAWMSWQIGGLGPMMGQLGFFLRQKEPNEGAITRYRTETARLLNVLETRLSQTPYLGGEEYSIADMASFPWVSAFLTMMKDTLPEQVRNLPATTRWREAIAARPAVQRGMSIPA